MQKRNRDDEHYGMSEDILSSGLRITSSVMVGFFKVLAWLVGFIFTLFDKAKRN